MNLPETCPFCDAGPGQYVNNYLCGTFMRPNVASRVHQTKVCLVSERARLAARVVELERDLEQAKADRARASMDARNPLMAQLAKLEARCKRLEHLGSNLRLCAGYLGSTASDDSDCITRAERACEAWDKEAKP